MQISPLGHAKRLSRALGTERRLLSTSKLKPALGFGITPVNGHVRYTWTSESGWDQGQVLTSPFINLHVNAGVLHYGLAVFEGLKAFEAQDGDHYVCNPAANAARMREGARRLCMPEVPEEIFVSAVAEAVSLNREFIPDYESGGALYIRPLLFASGTMLPLKRTDQFSLVVSATPVGNYFAGSTAGVSAAVVELDRAAPRGTGAVKAAGNYASDMYGLQKATEAGCDTSLYLDALHHRYIEEFSVANFVGIKDGVYVTPKTDSVLPSITNKMLMTLAREQGMTVEERPVDFHEEIEQFQEVAGSGTAVVLSPCASILRVKTGRKYEFGPLNQLAGLRDRLVRIQRGEEDNSFEWMMPIPREGHILNAAELDPERVLRRMLCAVSSEELATAKAEVTPEEGKDSVVNDEEQKGEVALKQLYDRLAGSYQKAGGGRVVAAAHCSSLLLNHLPVSRRGHVLDAGAGTGEAGAILKGAGVDALTAFDLSDNMLDEARKKGVYDTVEQGCLPDTPFDDNEFDAIVCAGCLAPGHASPATYAEFCRVLKPGGLVAFSVPRAYYESAEGQGHRFAIETLERVGAWERIFEEARSYFDEVEAIYFVFRRLDSSARMVQKDSENGTEAAKPQHFHVFP
mmetsp:Transcript_11609/g.22849  ORF Transcript_11609/g.22849 Transcript_11609/m.22849 type:complete len:630 (-) Transcript_11609:252-2141(-)